MTAVISIWAPCFIFIMFGCVSCLVELFSRMFFNRSHARMSFDSLFSRLSRTHAQRDFGLVKVTAGFLLHGLAHGMCLTQWKQTLTVSPEKVYAHKIKLTGSWLAGGWIVQCQEVREDSEILCFYKHNNIQLTGYRNSPSRKKLCACGLLLWRNWGLELSTKSHDKHVTLLRGG